MKPSASYYKQEVDKAIASLRLLKILKNKPKIITPEEREILLGFPSGGVLKEAGFFTDADNPRWLVEKRKELKSLINQQEWASLQNAGMLNAHYTKREIAAAIWQFVASFLKPGDKVLDPGCGTGRFFLDCPDDIKYVGVDDEPTSAAIAKAAHPKASIYCKNFLPWSYPQEFQAVIGNIPFVNGVKSYYLDNQKLSLGLHAQFFCKSIFHLQEGGVLALLTSIETLDAKGEDYLAFRRWVDKHCHFLGAVRLPSGAVHDGGTEVTTDLILLQKRKLGDKTPNPNWIETVGTGLLQQYAEKPEEIQINRWYSEHPEFILGELGFDPLTQGKRSAVLQKDGQDAIGELQKALNAIKGGNMGYTHYWWQPRMLDPENFKLFMQSIKLIGKASEVPLYLDFEENEDSECRYINLNADNEDEEGETCFFIDCCQTRLEQHGKWDEDKKLFLFRCKTDQKSYDSAVFAAMLAFAYHFPEDVTISSDGELSQGDFNEGIKLFEEVFGLKVEIKQTNPETYRVPLIVKFTENKKETETMTAQTNSNWEAFQVKFVDKKGQEAGDAAVQIHFPDKPPEKVTEQLNKMGFRFHSNGTKYWYCYLESAVPAAFAQKGIKNIESYARGLVKAYSSKGAIVSQEKPKPTSQTQTALGGGLGGMMKMLREMQEELRALRSEVAELKEAAGNSAEVQQLKEEVENLKLEKSKLENQLELKQQAIEAAVKKVENLETASKIMLDEKDRVIAEQQQTIATAVAEVDRIQQQYDTLVKSLRSEGFSPEDFAGTEETAEEAVAVSFDDDTPAVSFDESTGAEEPVADDAGGDRDDADSPAPGAAADSSEGFDFEELEELEDELGE